MVANAEPDRDERSAPLVAEDFVVPLRLDGPGFRLEPLGVRHNEADHRAWTSSVDHIRATPGYAGRRWPDPNLSMQDNRRDLERHAEHFERRVGFTYTVLDPDSDDVIGCVYLYPSDEPDHDVDVRSWVRADRAALDAPLAAAVRDWLATEWPFRHPDYAAR